MIALLQMHRIHLTSNGRAQCATSARAKGPGGPLGAVIANDKKQVTSPFPFSFSQTPECEVQQMEKPVRAVKELRSIDKRNHALPLATFMAAVGSLFGFSGSASEATMSSRRRSRSTSSGGCRGRRRWRSSLIRSRGRMPARPTGQGRDSRSIAKLTARWLIAAATKPWNSGAVSEMAGDRIWYADFSDLRTPGSYFVFDPTNRVRSFSFRIDEDVYKPVLRDSVRVFYYQRSGTPITEKNGGVWHHSGGHLGRNQDRAAQYTQEGRAQGRPRDVARRLVRRGRPEQVRALPGVHPFRPALGLRAKSSGLQRRHEYP